MWGVKRFARLLGWRQGIPGNGGSDNTIAENLIRWSQYDWDRKGEEWSNPERPQWKNSLVEHVLKPHIPKGARVLEIGPGAGRWTEHLLKRASHLQVVDLTPKCIELCKERFKHASNIEFFVNDGRDLTFIDPESIDRIWSFDVFVHILAQDIEPYLAQFATILRPGGRGIIHHGRIGNRTIGWRSDMTAELMVSFCKKHGLKVIDQFNSWDDGRVHTWPGLPRDEDPDIITVFERPAH